MSDKALVQQVFSFSERVRKEAKELDKLPGAALAAVLGGSLVVGVVGGGLFWIPAAMVSSMFAYRSVVTVIQYQRDRSRQKIQDVSEVCAVVEKINRSSLPIEYKEQLSKAAVLQVLPAPSDSGRVIQVLEHKGEGSENRENRGQTTFSQTK